MESGILNGGFFKMLLEAAPGAMVITDGAGIIAVINSQALELFGYARADLVGQPIEMLWRPQKPAQPAGRLEAFFLRVTRARGGSSMEFCGLHKEGREIPVEISVSRLRTEEGLYLITRFAICRNASI